MSSKDKDLLVRELELRRQLLILECRESFWQFCKVVDPILYQDHRTYLKTLCDSLQGLYEGNLINPNTNVPYKKMMINMPPRHGKSRTLVLMCQWLLGKRNENRIICCSYNDDTASEFSRFTRDGITNEAKKSPADVIYSDIFPDTKIQAGNASYQKWSLEGQFFNYLGAGIGGSITGRGCNVAIIDDPLKNADEAFNANRLDKIWQWYGGTFLSRKEEGAIEIINMTRWAKGDLCGRILEGVEADQWYVLKLEAYDKQNDNMLCPDLLSYESYLSLQRTMDKTIFRANYHQQTIDLQGILYSNLKTYADIPKDDKGNSIFEQIINYTDTADTGNDWLCSICAGVYQGQAYIIDVLFTKDAMEKTEPTTAKMLHDNNVDVAYIESNNGGRGFSRNVQRILWEKFHIKKPIIKWFFQSHNKISRILSNATYVMEYVYFPKNWDTRFPDFYDAITTYQREGKNKHDDASDAISGIVETIQNKSKTRSKVYSGRGSRN